MEKFKSLVLIVIAAAFAGCVSSGKYEASLVDVQNLKKDNTVLENKIKDKDTQNTQLKDSLKAKESELASLEEKLKKSDSEKTELEAKYAKLEKEHAELVKKRDQLTADNATLKTTLGAKKEELTDQIMAMKEKAAMKENAIKVLEGDTAAKDKEMAGLKSETNGLKSDVAALTAKLSANEIQIRQLNNEVQSKNTAIADLKKEIRDISTDKAKAIEEKEKAIAELKKTYDNLVSELSGEIKKGEIAVTQLRDKLTLQMVEKILFDSGSADIKGSGKKVMDRVAEVLKKVSDKQIRIEGYTDNVPIGPRIAKKFPTNWELSTARATNVVRYLKEKGGMDPKMLSAAGYAENNPVDTNDTDEGRAKNRRIEIVLIPL
jgi:chemotaxis protein MotB